MKKSYPAILDHYRTLDFSQPMLDKRLLSWQKAFNDEITSLCRGLPASQQAGALIFLMNYSGITIGTDMDFFKNYYHPAWTILAHIAEAGASDGTPDNFPHHIRAHAMAMFLHSLEDHLTDEEIRTDNRTLLLHGEAWRRYRNALDAITREEQNRRMMTEEYLDRYFSTIAVPPEEETLEGYCNHFRDQMATWTLTPFLLAQEAGVGIDPEFLCEAYEAFGIAWRLLDDLNDLEEDLAKGTRSAAYYVLEPQWQALFNLRENPRDMEELLKHLVNGEGLEELRALVAGFLSQGTEAAQSAQLAAFGAELKHLAAPVEKPLELQ